VVVVVEEEEEEEIQVIKWIESPDDDVTYLMMM